jgi:hypothetical protein
MKKTFAYLVTLGTMAFLASGVAFAQDPGRGFNGPGNFDDPFAKPGVGPDDRRGADWGVSGSISSSGHHPSVTVTTPRGDTDPIPLHQSPGEPVNTGRSFSPNWPHRNCGTIGVPPYTAQHCE